MIFQPVIVGPGLAGWNFLQATYDSQFEAFNRDPVLKRDTEYFAEKIGDVFTPQELVADRRLLSVALGAFGLSDDLNSQAFILKILEDGTGDPSALANRRPTTATVNSPTLLVLVRARFQKRLMKPKWRILSTCFRNNPLKLP